MTAKIMYSMGQGCHPALRVHKQAIGFMHYVSHHNEVVCSIQGIRVLAMIRIIAAIADVTPAPLIDATHIFSKPVHDFILFQGIMKTVFLFSEKHHRTMQRMRSPLPQHLFQSVLQRYSSLPSFLSLTRPSLHQSLIHPL